VARKSATLDRVEALRSMRGTVVSAPGRVELEPMTLSEPAAGEVVVRLLAGGICGSDAHLSHGLHHSIGLPYRPGHEVVGLVERAGADVELMSGTRVVVDPMVPCRRCKYCSDGRSNLCTETSFFGCGTPSGGLADFFTISASQAVPVPSDLSDMEAVLIEPLSTPVHAVLLAGGDLTGKSVVILGAGTIGLLTLIAARRAGAAYVAVSNTTPAKLGVARSLGADSTHDASARGMVEDIRADLGGSADVVFDCVAAQATTDQAVRLADRGGTVIVVGIPLTPVTLSLPVLQDRQIRLQGSATYTREDIHDAMTILGEGVVPAETLITGRYPLNDVSAAFAAATSRSHIKVVVQADHA
jgi:2-desacetyl-2-hydroxyethyl bacteriochlorophyllide A dehydrogenase